jgi:hypothetical protein
VLILQEATASLNSEAEVQSEVQRAITGAELIKDPGGRGREQVVGGPGKGATKQWTCAGPRLVGHIDRCKYERSVMPYDHRVFKGSS